ncbi:hypothetical protein [Agromyces larvae]|uniref:DUF8094 domain-containing protein n=1 Tax=Agromyces larvae TaxID=2929802 RepID=A0ABY4C5J0_9MICO|nr:hypothetical protein [Agromyces larvae]UOE45341.1 hypothetical protein MTO99_06155 [Agromyces larvae]
MRFVLAIAAFFAAAVMIGLGIAQRTVFLEPDRVSLVAELDPDAASYAVIQPDALAAHPGGQSIQVSSSGGTVFAAYGRSADVTAWIGDDPYLSVGFDAEAGALVTELREPDDAESTDADDADGSGDAAEGGAARPAPTATPVPTDPPADATTPATDAPAEPAVSPAGSDLWLDQLSADRRASMTVDLPEGVSVIVASGSEDPLPDTVAIAWPLDNSTPWAGPLIVGGAALFLVGAVLLVSGIVGHRRSRGPRRNVPKGRQKLPSAPKPNRLALGGGRKSGGGRRAMAATLLVVPALALTSCSADYWPSFENAPEPTETAAATPGVETPAPEADPVEPVVSVPQWERIMARIATFTADVDQSRDGDTLTQRFTGPALEARRANYSIRAALPEYPVPAPILAEPLTLILPQQAKADQWPRTVMTVATNDDDETVPPNVLVLTQAAPRENYKVVYAMSLAPDPGFPEVAPASVGAPLISPDYKGLVVPPSGVAGAFASVVQDGPASPQAELFDLEDTELDNLLDAATRKAERQAETPTVTLDISTSAAVDEPVVPLGTIDAGALVSATILRVEQARPNDGGTTGFQEGGPARALSGFTAQSAKGVQSTRAVQILFSVPSVGSGDQIRVLGWSESVIAASEIP